MIIQSTTSSQRQLHKQGSRDITQLPSRERDLCSPEHASVAHTIEDSSACEISILKFFAAKAKAEHTTPGQVFQQRRGDAIEGWDVFSRQDVQQPLRLARALRLRQSDLKTLQQRLAKDDKLFGSIHGVKFSQYVIANAAIQACLGAYHGLGCTVEPKTPTGLSA